MDRFYLALIFEPAGDLQRIRAMPLQSKRQRFQAAQNKKTIERAGNRAHRILQKRNLISEFLVFPNNGNTAPATGPPPTPTAALRGGGRRVLRRRHPGAPVRLGGQQ